MTRDAHNPYTATTSNDKGEELVQIVLNWYRANRNVLNATQVTAVTTAITAILNRTVNS